MKIENKKIFLEYFLIFIGSAIYALSTVIFIFPHSLLLGGTSGVSVILNSFISFSPGKILVAINILLIVLAFIFLGKGMAIKTLVGSLLTTVFVGAFEELFTFTEPLVGGMLLSSVIGASLIALASGIMFYVDSSSGGTDIIALIIKKFSNLKIGKALLVTDVLIVIVGGALSGITFLLCSFVGLLIKTLGIDAIIAVIKKSINGDVKKVRTEKKRKNIENTRVSMF
ncbi:MAG: YitT family protein [Ruminococcaceae bacterium]|nr:YitT family protein [Oscillospiraceae bacterium]